MANDRAVMPATKSRLTRAGHWILTKPSLVYAAVALLALGPSLAPGYLLTVDMVFAPDMSFPSEAYGVGTSTWASLPYLLVVQLMSAVLPGWVVQKLILFFVLWFLGLGAHKLIGVSTVAAYFAGLLYMLNPYVALRLLLGQWTLLAASAVIPFAVVSMLELLRTRSPVAAVKVALLWTLAGVFQLHGFYLVGIVLGVMALGGLIGSRSKIQLLKDLSIPAFVGGTTFLLLNTYWLGSMSEFSLGRIDRIPPQAIDIFSAVSSQGLPVGFELAAMGAFWWKEIVPDELIRFWLLLYAGLVFFVVNGFWGSTGGRWSRGEVAILGAIGFALALGPASAPTRLLFEFLWTYLPGFQGFRESHKLLAFLVLFYAYFGALGAAHFSATRSNHSLQSMKGFPKHKWLRIRQIVPWLALAVPVIYGIGLMGFSGEVRPVEYPDEWYEIRDSLKQDGRDGNALILPWHSFTDLDWLTQSQNRVANPARLFFGDSVIQADNLELPNYYSDSIDPISLYIEALLNQSSSIENIGAMLVPLNVSHVLVLKEKDFEEYSFLTRQSDLRIVIENSRLVLFENIHTTSSVLGLSHPSNDFDLFKGVSFEGLPRLDTTVVSDPVNVEKNGAVEIAYSTNDFDFVALALPQGVYRTDWASQGEAPLGYYLGFMPTFAVKGGSGVLRYEPFWDRVVWGYAVSLITLAGAIGLVIKKRTSRPASGTSVASA